MLQYDTYTHIHSFLFILLQPTVAPSMDPLSTEPTGSPSRSPSQAPSMDPLSIEPTGSPSDDSLTYAPSGKPSSSTKPSSQPSEQPSESAQPSSQPSSNPTSSGVPSLMVSCLFRSSKSAHIMCVTIFQLMCRQLTNLYLSLSISITAV